MKISNFFILTFILTVFDQLSKYIARLYLAPSDFVELIPNFIHLTHQENKGISFSLLSNLPDMIRVPLLSGISLVVICVLLYYLRSNWSKVLPLEKWGYALIIGGAFGNLIDRLFRQSVTDFMYFHFYEKGFFVNNIADDYISIGFVLLLWSTFTNKEDTK